MNTYLNSPELNRLILDHLISGIAAGNRELAGQLGLSTRMRAQLEDLRSGEVRRLAELPGCIRVEVDVRVLGRLLDYLAKEREAESTMRELIRRGAPQPLLHQLYSLSSRETSNLREHMGLPGTPGRTRRPTEQEERRAWTAFEELLEGDTGRELEPEEWLQLCDRSGIDLRLLWVLVNEWRQQGLLGNEEPEQDNKRRRAT